MADTMTVAVAQVQIVPTMEGSQTTIKADLEDILGTAGTSAGETTGTNVVTAISDKMSSAGATFTKAITIPILAAGGAAIKAFNDVDKGADIIAIKTGASGDALQEMESIMNSIASNVPADFNEIGSAVGVSV